MYRENDGFTYKQQNFYEKLRARINRWFEKQGHKKKYAEYILLVPDFFYLLCKLLHDPEVPVEKKAKLLAAITYFIYPLDVIPEAILGPLGYFDDLALAAYVLNDIINNVSEKIVLQNWVGEYDILKKIKEIIEAFDKLFGSGLWKKIKKEVFG